MLHAKNDRNIHFQLSGNPQGPKLMLLNSLGTSLQSWREVVGLLDPNYHILCIDKSGHGGSDPCGRQRRISDNAADVMAVMDAVGWRQANVCGVSIGGMTAIDLAIHHPDRLQKVILSNTSSFVASTHLIERAKLIQAFGISFVAAQVVGRFFTEQSAVLDNDRYVAAVRDFLSCDGDSYSRWCEAIAAMDYRPDLHRIQADTLIITGEHDKATPASMGQHLHGAIKGSSLVHLPFGHIPYLDDPRQYAGIISDFIP